MKYHLETIPVWDAFHLEDECPICAIYHKLEGEYLDTALGGAAMEPDIRLMTNELGFCQHHLEMLYAMRKRLPLALMLHTHLQEIEKDLAPSVDPLIDPEGARSGLFRRAPKEEESVKALLKTLHRHNSTCLVCDQITNNIDRYLYTILHLYQTDPNFKTALQESKGFCLPHFEMLLTFAEGKLHGSVRQDFFRDACDVEKKALARLDGQIYHFTKMFDFRMAGGDFGESRDSVPRVIAKLRGKPSEKSDGISTL